MVHILLVSYWKSHFYLWMTVKMERKSGFLRTPAYIGSREFRLYVANFAIKGKIVNVVLGT